MTYQMNPIEPFIIERDIVLIAEKAENFGKGIAEAFVRLAENLQNNGQHRECYGLIKKANDKIAYFSCFTELYKGEAEEKSMPTLLLPGGDYCSIKIDCWNKNLLHIGPTFDQLLKSGRVDTSSPCIEYYRSETELLCMVKAK